MNRQERRQRNLGALQRVESTHDSAIAPEKRRIGITTIIATIVLSAGAGAAIAAWSAHTPHEKAARQIVAGDGVTGPSDMIWVPGGEFMK